VNPRTGTRAVRWLGLLFCGLTVCACAAESTLASRHLLLSRVTGALSACALIAALSVSPLSALLCRVGRAPRLAQVVNLRRGLGLGSAGLALLHALLSTFTVLESWFTLLYGVPRLRAGLCALVILLALALSSFPRLVVRMRLRLWKELHVLAYAALLFVAQHVLLSPFAPRRVVLGVLALVLLVGSLRLVAARARPDGASEP
jgi:DMSO/TMAO reductase YedYZ heme-binding membrane subunit